MDDRTAALVKVALFFLGITMQTDLSPFCHLANFNRTERIIINRAPMVGKGAASLLVYFHDGDVEATR